MPYWSIYCIHCNGSIVDALLECVPAAKRSNPGYRLLFRTLPGAAFVCPYCGGMIGFDDEGRPIGPPADWPVFRYGRAELEIKKQADGIPAEMSLTDWAAQHRFMEPGTHDPFEDYTYAEHAPPNEVVS